MRYQGFVVEVINDELVLVNTGGQFWRIIASKELARLGGHRCSLQNSGVTFNFDGKSVTDFTTELPKHDGEQEISTIIFARREHTPSGGFGFLRRNDCGCSIHFSHSSVVTWGDIEVKIESKRRIKKWISSRANELR